MGATAYLKLSKAALVDHTWDLSTAVVAGSDAFIAGLVAEGAGARFDYVTFRLLDSLATKSFGVVLALLANTPQTLDLLDLSSFTAGVGDTAFAKAFYLNITNNEAVGSGKKVVVGNDGTAGEWYDPFGSGASGIPVDVLPGTSLRIYTKETAGWPVSTRHLLKFNPGTNAVNVSVAIGGA